MLTTYISNKFEKDMERMQKRGKDLVKLKKVIKMIALCETLPENLCNHKLHGKYKDHFECHVSPDWLLIYYVDVAKQTLNLERTGTHSDLF